MTSITFTVCGKAEPQGSARGFVVNGRAIITSDNPKLKGWRREVSKSAMRAYRGPALDGPMKIAVVFHLPAPKSLKTAKPHVTRPDLDKCLRGILDALTGVIYRDDGQVMTIESTKQYADVGTSPRAVITVTALTEKLF